MTARAAGRVVTCSGGIEETRHMHTVGECNKCKGVFQCYSLLHQLQIDYILEAYFYFTALFRY